MIYTLDLKKNLCELLVSCGGGRRLVDGLRQQHVHTIRPLVRDTLEDLTPLGLHMWDKDSTLHARTWTNQYSMAGELNHGTTLNSRDDTVSTWMWVFMTNHMEEATDKGNVATPEVHQRGEDVRLFST